MKLDQGLVKSGGPSCGKGKAVETGNKDKRIITKMPKVVFFPDFFVGRCQSVGQHNEGIN